MKHLIRLLGLVVLCVSPLVAEIRVVTANGTTIAINMDYVMAVKEVTMSDGSNLFYSQAQGGKVIHLNPQLYAREISTGLRNGNLTYASSVKATCILLRREANIQVATAGSGLISGGDANNVFQPTEIVIKAPITEVLKQLYPKPNDTLQPIKLD